MSIQQSYNDWSASYDLDRNLTRDLDQMAARQMLQGTRVGSLLEAGCGTGKNTAFYSQIADMVCAVDFSRGMLQQAREKISSTNVHFAMADLTGFWPCAGRTFDFVACNLILEHVQDLSFIFSQACRVLKDGGKLLVSELHPLRQEQGASATFSPPAGPGQAEIPTQIQAFTHHIPDFMRAAAENGLKHAQLREMWHAEDKGKPPRLAVFLFVK